VGATRWLGARWKRLMLAAGLARVIRGKVKRTNDPRPAAMRARDLVCRGMPLQPHRTPWVADMHPRIHLVRVGARGLSS